MQENAGAALVQAGGTNRRWNAGSAGTNEMDTRKPFHNMTSEQLEQAEATAQAFVRDKAEEIAGTFRAKSAILLGYLDQLQRRESDSCDRAELFARIAETGRAIEIDALEFLDLSTGATVARIVRTVPRNK